LKFQAKCEENCKNRGVYFSADATGRYNDVDITIRQRIRKGESCNGKMSSDKPMCLHADKLMTLSSPDMRVLWVAGAW